MKGRTLMIALLAFTALFAVALVWFQLFAFYERSAGIGALTVAGDRAGRRLRGHRRTTSPLKLRGCFRADPAAFAAATPAPRPCR
jgi:hypothetical protein